jgi:hypothetical protein
MCLAAEPRKDYLAHIDKNETMHISALIALVLVIVLLLAIGGICGSMGWKLASLTHDLRTGSSAPLSSYTFRNGDLVLFSSGVRKLAGSLDALQMLMADCPITHVGMVVENPDNGLQRCWELALDSHLPDIINLTNLRVRMQKYSGTVLVRPLKRTNGAAEPLSSSATYTVIREMQRAHRKCATTYRGSFYLNTYDSRTSEFFFLHPPLPLDISRSGDREWICTDLVSETYRRLGVFHSQDSSLWPRDFYSKNEKLPLSSEWVFSDEVRLTV